MIERNLECLAMFRGAHRQMRFISGPRQSGKTTLARAILAAHQCERFYYNWDIRSIRQRWRENSGFLWEDSKAAGRPRRMVWACMDEIHKMPKWKDILKGLFDSLEDRARFLVTGSARLEMFRRSGDSLAGRYFLFHLLPLTLRETINRARSPVSPVKNPAQFVENRVDTSDSHRDEMEGLIRFGAFPEPFTRQTSAFSRKWHDGNVDRLVREDLRDITRIADLENMATLVELLPSKIGNPLSLNSLCRDLQVSHTAIRNYVRMLDIAYVTFEVRPYTERIARSILKERKVYLYDWTGVSDPAARFENYVAHELRAMITGWNDAGLGRFELAFVRTRLGHETDFLILRDRDPWILFEAKLSDRPISPHHAAHAAALGNIPVIQLCRDRNILTKEKKGVYRISAARFFS